MNYRHHFHAGNYADVMKHALLTGLVRALQRKPQGVLLLDTHAGRGAYDLARAATGDTLARQAEHPDGIGRLWREAELPSPVADYVELVRGFDRERAVPNPAAADGPQFYPGSPWLLHRLAREQDRIALCEMHPEEFEMLRGEFARLRRMSVQHRDGYGALRAMLPPPERRALILIDPPYEAADEGETAGAALAEGLRRFPSGVYALWYPLAKRARTAGFLGQLAALPLPPTWVAELTVDPLLPGMMGCGLAILNPPWQFVPSAEAWLPWLAQRLAQSPDARATSRWLVPE